MAKHYHGENNLAPETKEEDTIWSDVEDDCDALQRCHPAVRKWLQFEAQSSISVLSVLEAVDKFGWSWQLTLSKLQDMKGDSCREIWGKNHPQASRY